MACIDRRSKHANRPSHAIENALCRRNDPPEALERFFAICNRSVDVVGFTSGFEKSVPTSSGRFRANEKVVSDSSKRLRAWEKAFRRGRKDFGNGEKTIRRGRKGFGDSKKTFRRGRKDLSSCASGFFRGRRATSRHFQRVRQSALKSGECR